ncbi:MAG: glutamate-cysteine ligase family protein, partial [Myxococcales bacterium]|nr:glutamate-cysteine ligase family protein [Myxococcales bacterium]
RSFMNDGFQGVKANYDDWVIHLRTLFPEVRLKGTLEYRGADAQSNEMSFALPALWKGLLYDDRSFGRLEALVDGWSYREVERHRESFVRHGVRSRFLGREVTDWAGEVVELAEAGLRRIDDQNNAGEDESVLLVPLRALLERAECPADRLLKQIPDDLPTRADIIALTKL